MKMPRNALTTIRDVDFGQFGFNEEFEAKSDAYLAYGADHSEDLIETPSIFERVFLNSLASAAAKTLGATILYSGASCNALTTDEMGPKVKGMMSVFLEGLSGVATKSSGYEQVAKMLMLKAEPQIYVMEETIEQDIEATQIYGVFTDYLKAGIDNGAALILSDWKAIHTPTALPVTTVISPLFTFVSDKNAHAVQSPFAVRVPLSIIEKVDEEYRVEAKKAIDEANSFSHSNLIGYGPRVSISDDGIISLQWRGEHEGVLLIFAGDGLVTCSIKLPKSYYAASDISFPYTQNLPSEVRKKIDLLEALRPSHT